MYVKEEDTEDSIKMTFIDKDTADIVMGANADDLSEEEKDMSTKICVVYINKESHKITFVEHGFHPLTSANKEQNLGFALY